jgi:hypothetical protein
MSEESKCKGCGAPIIWITTPEGKAHPVDAKPMKVYVKVREVLDGFEDEEVWKLQDGFMTHFATCPKANEFRTPNKENPCDSCGLKTKAECVECRGHDKYCPF